jgi:heme/copper-type cytochrome/quinol oxidase subunit 2
MDFWEIVFDFEEFRFDWKILVISLLLIVFLIISYLKNRRLEGKKISVYGVRKKEKAVLAIPIFLIGFILVAAIGLLIEFVNLKKIYSDGDYKTVEGFVEDFNYRYYKEGLIIEEFRVKKIFFSYDSGEQTYGFNHVREKGGPIRDGQYLRISYLPEKDNLILKIEKKEK